MYGIILIFFALIFTALAEQAWKYGRHGEFAALVIGEIFAVYGGVLLNRIWKNEACKRDVNNIQADITGQYTDKQDGEYDWHRAYESISDSKRKISYIRHDIANHVQVLQAMQEQCGIKLDSLDEVQAELKRLSSVKYCDNAMFDMAMEQRIRAMQGRGLQVHADIQLTGIENVQSEQLCLVFWLLLDGISDNLSEGQHIAIRIYKHSTTNDGVMLAWSIEGDCDSINKRNVKLLEFLLDRMNGSIMVDIENGRTTETGMMEVRYANGR